MYRKASQKDVLLEKVTDARSYLMMLVSSLMEIQKTEKELGLNITGNLDEALNDLSMLDEVLEESQSH